jgi:aminopeptidase N
MRDAQAGTIYLKDYRPPDYLIEATELEFQLHEDHALVSARLTVRRNEATVAGAALELHGQEMELLSVRLDDRELKAEDYLLTADSLVIADVPEHFVLTCQTRILPQENTSLEGLYKSRSMFCTQCEAEGFRKITYYLDRPDVMSVFTVAIEADQARYPVLLCNGNLVAEKQLANGRHHALWHDPFPKPAYLFALVAGDLVHVQDHFRTGGGRDVTLRIYVEAKDRDKCDHAMRSLQRAMRWDEEVYGREYDLDVFNIVAVDDFNMGAMENKSLNIFNTSCVLCSPDITTDAGFQRVESIVAHEYFHNWSGNRVTCRDWFQLSLKEGFTVFRDAEFSADMGSPTLKRVEDVNLLRSAQFAEDAGPMAHPVRPDSFIEISNFYTLTVYEKGAEVVRMIHTLLGPEKFRAGSDLYFSRHDGQAVTCEDFVCAMEEAGDVDLGQFRNWYSQAGTPRLVVRDEYDAVEQRYTLVLSQSCPPTPGQAEKAPFVIPVAMGLLGEGGNLPLYPAGEAEGGDPVDNTHSVLVLREPEQRFVFERVSERPIPSLLRGFSAPVRLDYEYSKQDLCALMSRDGDGFVRWDAAQQLALQVIDEAVEQLAAGQDVTVDPLLPEACGRLLANEALDAAMVADMLQLPSENYLAELASQDGGADVDAIHAARTAVQGALADTLQETFATVYRRLQATGPYAPVAARIAERSLANTCLDFLSCRSSGGLELAEDQLRSADNLTDRLAALRAIALYGDEAQRRVALDDFHARWRHEGLVINQWFQLQAMITAGDAVARVRALMNHPDFELRNPNKVRALIGSFAGSNPVSFHRRDGAGYTLVADAVIELNSVNPQIASRLLNPLTKWSNYPGRSAQMLTELQRIAAVSDLSPDVFEVVSKSLQGAV